MCRPWPTRIVIVTAVLWPIWIAGVAACQETASVRPAYCAGNWYPPDPADREALLNQARQM